MRYTLTRRLRLPDISAPNDAKMYKERVLIRCFALLLPLFSCPELASQGEPPIQPIKPPIKPVAESLPLKKQKGSKIVRSTEISPHKNTDIRARKHCASVCVFASASWNAADPAVCTNRDFERNMIAEVSVRTSDGNRVCGLGPPLTVSAWRTAGQCPAACVWCLRQPAHPVVAKVGQ